jgi:hypothetical protein
VSQAPAPRSFRAHDIDKRGGQQDGEEKRDNCLWSPCRSSSFRAHTPVIRPFTGSTTRSCGLLSFLRTGLWPIDSGLLPQHLSWSNGAFHYALVRTGTEGHDVADGFESTRALCLAEPDYNAANRVPPTKVNVRLCSGFFGLVRRSRPRTCRLPPWRQRRAARAALCW